MTSMPRLLDRVLVPALLALCAVLAAAESATAGVCTARSGAQTTPLVELYTSEGCNSCPPADRWLSTTFPAGANVAVAIPLAFHVDYWDRLGWKDRFAAASYSERQREAMRANRSGFVYTPQVLLQGKDFRDWGGKADAAFAAISAKPARAEIALEAQRRPDAIAVKAFAHVANATDRKATRVNVALVDSGLVSDVEAGENAGVRLRHDHVVRAMSAITIDADGDGRGEVTLALPAEAGNAPTVVAFVQNAASGAVLQALALPLEGCIAPR
jgi:hypothetical protein